MAPSNGKWGFHFAGSQGGDPELAMKEHFLGGALTLALNESSTAVFEFLLPSAKEGILASNGLPPMDLTIEDGNHQTVFSGKAIGLNRSGGATGRSVLIRYQDPLGSELSDVGPLSHPEGSLDDVLKYLTKGKELSLSVDPSFSTRLAAGGGDHIPRLTFMVQIVEGLGGYLFYHPHQRKLLVKKWKPEAAQSVEKEALLSVVQDHVDALAAASTLTVFGRKRLKNEWTETAVTSTQAAVTPGAMGSELEAWGRAQSMKRDVHVFVTNHLPSEERTFASDLLSAQIARSARVQLRVRGLGVLPGTTLSISEQPAFRAGEVLVRRAIYRFSSATPVGNLEGVRA